jgi:hypothetical protein
MSGLLLCLRGGCANELHVAEAHRTALDLRETSPIHDRNDLRQVEMRMRVQAACKTFALVSGSAEVYRQKSASRL